MSIHTTVYTLERTGETLPAISAFTERSLDNAEHSF